MPTVASKYQVSIVPKKAGVKLKAPKSFYKSAKTHIIPATKKVTNRKISQSVDKVVYGYSK